MNNRKQRKEGKRKFQQNSNASQIGGELLESEDEEENDKRRNERKQTNQPKTPIKATVNWEKPQSTKEESESENETNSNTSND